jgi:KipI family sensor histidine kinase inhibitor
VSSAELLPLGENALIVRLSHVLDAAVNDEARALAVALESACLPGITDVVPANSSVGIYFSHDTNPESVRLAVENILKSAEAAVRTEQSPLHNIPVLYNGPDIEDVAARTGMTVGQIIEIHSGREYRVFAVGFAPGFGYLGEVDERISIPRRSVPRTRVPAGSVAIANRQTAIYPLETPGGWNIIGSTSVAVFDRDRSPAALFQVGDRVRFIPHD